MLMRKFFLFAIVLSMLSQTNCIQKKIKLDGLWFYVYTSGGSGNEYEDATPANFIFLEPDGSYTRDFGRFFDYGRWTKSDSMLQLVNHKDSTIRFSIRRLTGTELQLVNPKGLLLIFDEQPGKFSSASENPFSIENNQWRIPASKKENEQELKDRLKNHFRFSELYFKWALDSDIPSIDVRSTPSPLKIYGNGFALKEFEVLPAAWRSYFFDEDDCRKANEILKEIFKKSDIGWAHTENKYKMFISAFQQLQQHLK
jgi:hypothetical protein